MLRVTSLLLLLVFITAVVSSRPNENELFLTSADSLKASLRRYFRHRRSDSAIPPPYNIIGSFGTILWSPKAKPVIKKGSTTVESFEPFVTESLLV
uniref:Secreted peptide n=1 Tax=Panagrellus redivivus TaxID=6233 RepID=A0A7E4ZRE5_PANRE